MEKLNDSLKRVIVGEHKKVPIEESRSLWFLWITESGEWDAELVTRPTNIIKSIEKENVNLIFCVWNGEWKTNLFLMDKKDLIKRLRKRIK